MKLGRIPWINTLPVYGAMDRGIVPVNAETVTGTASELNDLLALGKIQASVVSAVEYARNASEYHLLADLAISSDGPVKSVLLFSRQSIEMLDKARILTTSSSRTSVLLLELLCRQRWKITPSFETVPAEVGNLEALSQYPHDGILVIGDAALHLAAQNRYPVVLDLGQEWKTWTGLPFVFAVWAVRREVDHAWGRSVHQALLASRQWGLAHLDELAMQAAAQSGFAEVRCRDYLAGLDYSLADHHLAGLTDFFARLAREGLAPDNQLSFLSAA